MQMWQCLFEPKSMGGITLNQMVIVAVVMVRAGGDGGVLVERLR